MKVKLKTKDQLILDGCKTGSLSRRYGHHGMFFGTQKEPTVVCSWYQEKHLGKTGVILRASLDRTEPKVEIKIGNHTSWFPWIILDGCDLSKFKDKRKTKRIGGGKATYCPVEGFSFSCSFSDLSKKQGQALARWVLEVSK